MFHPWCDVPLDAGIAFEDALDEFSDGLGFGTGQIGQLRGQPGAHFSALALQLNQLIPLLCAGQIGHLFRKRQQALESGKQGRATVHDTSGRRNLLLLGGDLRPSVAQFGQQGDDFAKRRRLVFQVGVEQALAHVVV